jgi:lipoate-protein ligase B
MERIRAAKKFAQRNKKTEAWVLNLGMLPYDEALALQENLVNERREGRIRDILILLEHPPVFTVTREKTAANIIAPLDKIASEGIALHKTDRGGDVTYHGPGQLVGYVIMDLSSQGADLHRYVHNIEQMIINLLRDYEVEGQRDQRHPGVWVKDEKIAAIGIAVKPRWISMHGFALNVNPNMNHFSYIFPCGIRDKGVTSLAKLLGRAVEHDDLRRKIICHFGEVFGLETTEVALDQVMGE